MHDITEHDNIADLLEAAFSEHVNLSDYFTPEHLRSLRDHFPLDSECGEAALIIVNGLYAFETYRLDFIDVALREISVICFG